METPRDITLEILMDTRAKVVAKPVGPGVVVSADELDLLAYP